MTMDPYLKLACGGHVHRTTTATDAGTSAQWDECFRVPLTGNVQGYVRCLVCSSIDRPTHASTGSSYTYAQHSHTHIYPQ